MSVAVHHGDCRDIIPALGMVVDAVVTDPPYEIGFMGSDWDKRGVAFDPATWRIIGSVLRPGGFLLAFGGTRTYHRMTCAIEDAGFVIQDCLMWLFGSGFPKRRDMLKPAYEPIVLAYKPGGKRTMQVDECRIACDDKTPFPVGATSADGSIKTGLHSKPRGADDAKFGRWPANICHDGSADVLAGFPDAPGQQAIVNGTEPSSSARFIYNGLKGRHLPRVPIGDTDSAARFFYSAKADAQDRWGSRHPTVKPVELLKWLVPLVTPPGGLVLDPFAGSGTTGVAALATWRNCILIERENQYVADIRERLAFYAGEGRHSLAAKARRIADKPLGGLFEHPYDADADSLGSYLDAIKACEERHKAGEPLGEFFQSTRKVGA